ncbi:MAG: hypothetical protein AB7E83_19240 [Ramlibacter sp.]
MSFFTTFNEALAGAVVEGLTGFVATGFVVVFAATADLAAGMKNTSEWILGSNCKHTMRHEDPARARNRLGK